MKNETIREGLNDIETQLNHARRNMEQVSQYADEAKSSADYAYDYADSAKTDLDDLETALNLAIDAMNEDEAPSIDAESVLNAVENAIDVQLRMMKTTLMTSVKDAITEQLDLDNQ